MGIIRMNTETALIPPTFAAQAHRIVKLPLDAHATTLLHAAAAHGAVAVACVLAQLDDDAGVCVCACGI